MDQNSKIAPAAAEQSLAANPADVASIDSIIAALYEVISGESGVKRDWNRLRSLFVPDAKMIPPFLKSEERFDPRLLTVEGYIIRSGAYVEANGFFEREISRKSEQFGNLAHVFSTYEGRHQLSDETPFVRGINSVQLIFDDARWRISSLVWDTERPDNPLPEKYLK